MTPAQAPPVTPPDPLPELPPADFRFDADGGLPTDLLAAAPWAAAWDAPAAGPAADFALPDWLDAPATRPAPAPQAAPADDATFDPFDGLDAFPAAGGPPGSSPGGRTGEISAAAWTAAVAAEPPDPTAFLDDFGPAAPRERPATAVAGLAVPDGWVGAAPIAAAPEADTAPTEAAVVFTVGGADYAVPVGQVVEVTARPPVAAVPFAPPWLLGVANLRGDVVGVIDLRRVAGVPEAAGRAERLVVVRDPAGGATCGLVVDAVRGLRRLPLGGGPAAGPLARFAARGSNLDGVPVTVLAAGPLLAEPAG